MLIMITFLAAGVPAAICPTDVGISPVVGTMVLPDVANLSSR